jgi:hypothetical protein
MLVENVKLEGHMLHTRTNTTQFDTSLDPVDIKVKSCYGFVKCQRGKEMQSRAYVDREWSRTFSILTSPVQEGQVRIRFHRRIFNLRFEMGKGR